ncbi:MAG: autotransporter domain-containing protein [Haliea sp.]|nr:MAG: autotransporter domain-containing protein [Haliea sp.]
MPKKLKVRMEFDMRDQTRKHIAGVGDAGLLVLSHGAGRHVLRDQRLPNLPRLAASGPYRRGRAFPRIKRISLLVSQALALGASAFLSPLASWAGNVDVAAGTGLQATLGNAASGDTVTLTTDNGTYTTNIVNIRSATLQLGAGVTSARITGTFNNSTMEPVPGAPQTLTVQVNGGQTLQMETTLRDNNANILSVTKTGTGTLNLQRNASTVSSYSGATTISAGTLRLTGLNAIGDTSAVFVATGATFDLNGSTETVGNLSGDGAVTLGAGALTLNQSTASTFSGVMSGSGSLTKAGAGTLTLTGANNYSGGTTVNAGVLAGTTSSLQGAIVNNAAVNFDQATSGSYAGAISGTGTLTKDGTGTVTLSGVNSYGGGTTVNAGTLRAGAAGAFMTGTSYTVNNGTLDLNGFNLSASAFQGSGGSVNLGTATLTLTQAGNSSYAGAITGTGALVKTGAGTLTLSGVNSYGGGTTVNAGVLAGTTSSLQGAIVNNAAVHFDQTGSGSYAGAMSGTGTLTKAGSGSVALTGVNTYTGATSINAGTLAVNGSITSPVTVNNGGTLGGSGTINGAVTTASGGILAPGNSIGTLTVNGQVSFAAGSVYRVEVDPAGNADRINVTGAPGTASLGGATVDVQAGAGSYQANTRYTLLNATGGVTGTFGAVTSSLAFLTPSLAYDANNVFLSLVRNQLSFADAAATPNQRAAATILQASAAGAAGDMLTVVNAVTGLSTAQAQSAFDAVGGTSLSAMQNAGAAFADGFGQQIQRRLGTVAPATGFGPAATFGAPLLLAANQWQADGQVVGQAGMGAALDNAQRAAQRDQRGFWVRAYGAERQTDGDGNAPGNRQRGKGLSLGVDTELREGLVIGAALSGGESRVSVSGRTDAGRSRGTGFGVYGSYAAGPWTFKGLASLASNTNHMDRAISFGGLARTASSDFDSRSQSLYAEVSHDLPQGSYLLQPLAALSYVRTQTDGFTETGAGALNLQVAGQTTRSTRTLLGSRTVHQLGKLTVEPRLTWAHEFGNVNAPLVASYTGAPGAGNFQVSGVALKRDSLALGLGVSGALSKGFTLTADAQWEGNSQQRNLALFVALRAAW